MKRILDHIENLKAKPHHIRRRFAASAATFATALIALVWLGASIMTGAFAVRGGSFALSTGQEGGVATTSASDTQGLAGAAAALEDKSAPAHIEIVDAAPAPSSAKKTEPTILPF